MTGSAIEVLIGVSANCLKCRRHRAEHVDSGIEDDARDEAIIEEDDQSGSDESDIDELEQTYLP